MTNKYELVEVRGHRALYVSDTVIHESLPKGFVQLTVIDAESNSACGLLIMKGTPDFEGEQFEVEHLDCYRTLEQFAMDVVLDAIFGDAMQQE